MSVNRKRKSKTTNGASDYSAKKQSNEEIDSTTDRDEIKGQNSTAKRKIIFATCMKCIGRHTNHYKDSALYNTLDCIRKHKYEVDRRKSNGGGPVLHFKIGDENGMPLFNVTENYRHIPKVFKFRGTTDYTCTIDINDNDEIEGCGMSSKLEWLIEHQKIVHDVEYSTEFFEQNHEREDKNSEKDVEDKNSESHTEVEPFKTSTKVQFLECGECRSKSYHRPRRGEIQNRKKFKTLDDILNHICPPKNYRKFFGARQGLSHCSIMGTHGETLFLIEKSPHQTQSEFNSATCWLGECYHSKLSFFTKVEDFIEHQKNEHNIEFSENFMLKPGNEVANVENTDTLAMEHTNGEKVNTEIPNQDCWECVIKSYRIQALETAHDEGKTKLETEVASRQAMDEGCNRMIVEKDNRIQALETANAEEKTKLKTEVASRKALEASLLVMKNKNGEEVNTEGTIQDCLECAGKTNRIETEVATRKALEESNTKYRKLRQGWAVKVFQSDPSNEDLDNLLSLEPEMLFKKYEKIMKETNSGRIKLKETTETLQDVKIKLKLQTEQRDIYEKQLSEVREVLHLPAENCNFGNILPAVKVLIEQNETNHYTNSVENLGN